MSKNNYDEEWTGEDGDGLPVDLSKCPCCKKPRVIFEMRKMGKKPWLAYPDRWKAAYEAEGRCCNPQCNGRWGTGCWHCHSPRYSSAEALAAARGDAPPETPPNTTGALPVCLKHGACQSWSVNCPKCTEENSQIPPKIDPDKEPYLVALRRIADALEMANGLKAQEVFRKKGLSADDASTSAGCARYLVSASAGLKGAE